MEAELYRLRFSDTELKQARNFWVPICQFLQRYIAPSGTTIDLGAGYCHFINTIASRHKIAVDINAPAIQRYAAPDVQCIESNAADLSAIPSGSANSVFASNVYEHFQTREDVAASFREVRRVLQSGGRFLILQPNFAYCSRSYFDFFDHRLIFTDQGMIEGLYAAGFRIAFSRARFLPFTSKSRLPKAAWLVSLYLRVPVLWRVLGAQMFIVAEKP